MKEATECRWPYPENNSIKSSRQLQAINSNDGLFALFLICVLYRLYFCVFSGKDRHIKVRVKEILQFVHIAEYARTV